MGVVSMRRKAVFIKKPTKMGDNLIIIVPKALKDLFKDKRVQVEVYDKEKK